MKIVAKKGLDIPLAGQPIGSLQNLPYCPDCIALNLNLFEDIRFKLHVKVGESIKIGQPLVENKAVLGQMFVSPAGGIIKEIRRGIKRRLLNIVIQLENDEPFKEYGGLKINAASRQEILNFFMQTGLFPHIRLRPFNLIPDPKYVPRAIFVNAIETRPFIPSYEMQLKGYEEYFQIGLTTLAKLTTGRVHLVYNAKSICSAFLQAKSVEKHIAAGPHPAGSSSFHIHKIAPIRAPDDYVWTLSAIDAIVIGKMVAEGRYFIDRIISIAGNGILNEKRGFFAARLGYPIKNLIQDRLSKGPVRFISGDPLTGVSVTNEDFMNFSHTCFSVIPENIEREPFHFLKLGLNKFTATRAYLTRLIRPPSGGYSFTTNQHGEERAFIDGSVYDRVMPLRIPTMHLIKAILSKDFELAQQLGLLEVIPEDFALPTFVCPSKIEMMDIVKEGLNQYAKEMGH